MLRKITLIVATFLTLTVSAQKDHINFWGFQVGVDTVDKLDRILFDKSYIVTLDMGVMGKYYEHPRLDEGNSCQNTIHINIDWATKVVKTLNYTLSHKDWEVIRSLAVRTIKKLKKNYSQFEIFETGGSEGSFDYKISFTKSEEIIRCYSIKEESGQYNFHVFYERGAQLNDDF